MENVMAGKGSEGEGNRRGRVGNFENVMPTGGKGIEGK